MIDSAQNLRGVLQAHGLRCTSHRVQVYRALAASSAHPTAAELLSSVRHDQGEMSLATVYNALEALAEAGLVRRIAPAGGVGPCRYDADVCDHVHAVLPDGRVVDVPPALSAGLRDAAGTPFQRALAEYLGIPVAEVDIRVVVR